MKTQAARCMVVVSACLVLCACNDGSNSGVVEPINPTPDTEQAPASPDNDAPDTYPVAPDTDPPDTAPDSPGTADAEPETPPETPPDTAATVPPPDGVPSSVVADTTLPQLPAGTRAQAYTGEFASNPGVFIINDSDRLIGLVDAGDGQSVSVRAEIDSGASPSTLAIRRFSHSQQTSVNSQISSPVISAFAFRSEAQLNQPAEIIDGLQINSLGGEIFLALQADDTRQLLPVSAESLQGRWSSNYSLCDSNGNQCASVVFDMSISGSALSGNAGVIAADGTDLLPSQLSGTLTQRGAVVDVELGWNTYRYSGFAFVKPANPTDLYMVLTTDSEIADERMLALTLVRLQS